MSNEFKCGACRDSGMTMYSNDLDCAAAGCNATAERAKLEKEIGCGNMPGAMRNLFWQVYSMGKKAGAAEAVPAGWNFTRHADGDIVVQKDTIGGFSVSEHGDEIASSILWYLANDILAADPKP